MRVRPWPIVIIAVVCIFAPLFNIVYSSGLQQKGIFEYFRVILEYRPALELILWVVLPILVGISILAFNNWSYYLFIGFMCLVIFMTYDQWKMYPERFSLGSLVFFEFVNFVVLGYFLLPSVRIIYFTPQLRWWQQKPRFICEIAGFLKTGSTQTECLLKNISEGGVLVKSLKDFEENENVSVEFKLVNTDIQASGKVVHRGLDGYGIMFQEIKSDIKAFKQVIKSLPEAGFKPRVEIPHWTVSFKEWLVTFIKTGKGIIPKPEERRSPK